MSNQPGASGEGIMQAVVTKLIDAVFLENRKLLYGSGCELNKLYLPYGGYFEA